MAEIFGIVAGKLGVAGLFNNCVQCFEYIQLGRTFGRDYEICQLRLDFARLRLSRWGEAVNIHQNKRFTSKPTNDDDKEAAMAISYLEEIQYLIQGIEMSAKRYKLASPSRDTSLASGDDMTVVGNKCHHRFTAIARRRHPSAGVKQKVSWALYDRKEFDAFVSRIITLLDDLENLFPMESTHHELVEKEIDGIDDAPSLAALLEAAKGVDPVMSEAVASRLVAGSNSSGVIATTEQADVQVGHRYSDQVVARGLNMTDKTTNSAGNIEAGGSSRVQVGNRFGGL